MGIKELIDISHLYGGDPEYVLGGGGNSSWKDDGTLYVKASGFALGTIDESGFAALDLATVCSVLEKNFPSDLNARESQVLSALMAARLPGQTMRPSVETMLHALFPYLYVVHTHPALVNGLTCSVDGPTRAAELFGDLALWIPYTTPGYVLSRALKDAFDLCAAESRSIPKIVFLQNHGIFVAADTIAEMEFLYDSVFCTLRAEVGLIPDLSATGARGDEPEAKALAKAIQELAPGSALRFASTVETVRYLASSEAFAPLAGSFTPDHIVYAGAKFLFLEGGSGGTGFTQELHSAWKAFAEKEGFTPRIIAARDLGIFAAGASSKIADLALALFLDAVKVATYSLSFGGFSHMGLGDVEFIKKWEVEQYRSSVAAR